MIIKRYTVTKFSGLFSLSEKAAITKFPVTEISFKDLASDKAKMRALEMGFSPAISFELIDGVEALNLGFDIAVPTRFEFWKVIEGETAKATIAIHMKEDFWNYRP